MGSCMSSNGVDVNIGHGEFKSPEFDAEVDALILIVAAKVEKEKHELAVHQDEMRLLNMRLQKLKAP